jgi:uncharacterized protein (DUF433 family)
LAGSRLPARTLLAMVDRGDSWERIVDGWPWLTLAHVDAAREWQLAAAHLRVEAEVASGVRDARSLVAIPETLARGATVTFSKVVFGVLAGRVDVSADFDEPLPDEAGFPR